MKNEEIAALLQDMKNSFKEYSENQFEKFTELLAQHSARTEEKSSKISPSSPTVTEELKSPIVLPCPSWESGESSGSHGTLGAENRDMDAIIKGLRVKVARFDGSNVE